MNPEVTTEVNPEVKADVKVKKPRAKKEVKAEVTEDKPEVTEDKPEVTEGKVKKPKAKKTSEPQESLVELMKSPVREYEMVDVDDTFFMIHKVTQKVYRADLSQDGDSRALVEQQVGLYKDGVILPIFDEDE